MNSIAICTILYLLIFIPVALSSVKKIEEGTVAVIERLGKFNKVVPEGILFVIPVFDKVTIVDLKEKAFKTLFQSIMTGDRVIITIEIELKYQVDNPLKICYRPENIESTLTDALLQVLLTASNKVSLDEIIMSKNMLGNTLKESLNELVPDLGIKINDVVVQNIFPQKGQSELS